MMHAINRIKNIIKSLFDPIGEETDVIHYRGSILPPKDKRFCSEPFKKTMTII